MEELAKEFEKTAECKIRVIKGGSGKLLKMLLKNKNADLFLPGSDSYIKKMEQEFPGLIIDKEYVGYNKAALFVKKENPKKIENTLDSLTDERYTVVIGSPQKGSIGKETKRILTKHGSYEQVSKKAIITEDSIGLVRAIKMDKADISIDWFATSTWTENKDDVDALEISEEFAPKKNLILTVLKDSEHQDLARSFLKLASSEHGKNIFKKYGLGE